MNLWQKTKLMLQLRAAWNDAEKQLNTQDPKPMKLKPGITTTEFWTTAVLGLVTLGLTLADKLDGTYAAAAVTILGAVYTAGRTLTKVKNDPPK